MIEFFFDCSSPWTYLAFHNIQPLAKEFGEEISWRPILVGGIFNTINPSVYATREHPVPAKLAYQKKDMADWARSTGLAIKMRPTVFPVNSVKTMRGCIWLGKDMVPFARAAFEIYWGEDQDISQDAVLTEVCKRARRRSRKVLRWHRPAGDQGSAQGQYRRSDGARRFRLADDLHRQDRHVFRQRPPAAGPRSSFARQGACRLMPKAVVCRELGPPERLRLESFPSHRSRRGRCASPFARPGSIFRTS